MNSHTMREAYELKYGKEWVNDLAVRDQEVWESAWAASQADLFNPNGKSLSRKHIEAITRRICNDRRLFLFEVEQSLFFARSIIWHYEQFKKKEKQ